LADDLVVVFTGRVDGSTSALVISSMKRELFAFLSTDRESIAEVNSAFTIISNLLNALHE